MRTFVMDIEFGLVKAKANLHKHRVSFAHAEQVLRDPMALRGPHTSWEQNPLDLSAQGQ